MMERHPHSCTTLSSHSHGAKIAPTEILETGKGLGIVVHDKETGLNHNCDGEVPPAIVEWVIVHRGNLQSQINQCELLALVAAVMTFPHLLRDRHVVFWADNTTTLATTVHGYFAYPYLAALSNTLHLLLAGRLPPSTHVLHTCPRGGQHCQHPKPRTLCTRSPTCTPPR